jgi:hypothetical protein
LLPVRIDEIDHRERQIERICIQTFCTERAHFLDRARVHCLRRQFSEQRELALANDTLGVIGIGAENATRAALVVGHGAVGEGVVGLLRVAVAHHDQEQRFVVSPFILTHSRLRAWSDFVPDFMPHDRGGLAQRLRVLAPTIDL